MNPKVDCFTYLTKFDWDFAKYPVKQPLKSIVETVSKQVSQIENDLKSKATAYNAIKQTLAALQKKQSYAICYIF
jgi:V-type H+-transporting ATPase subunit C